MIKHLHRQTHECKRTPTKSQSLNKNSADTCQTLSPSFFEKENRGPRHNIHFKLDSEQNTAKHISRSVFFHSSSVAGYKKAKIHKPGRWSDISNELSVPLTLSNRDHLSELRDKAVCGTIWDVSAVKVEGSSYPLAPRCHQFPAACEKERWRQMRSLFNILKWWKDYALLQPVYKLNYTTIT